MHKKFILRTFICLAFFSALKGFAMEEVLSRMGSQEAARISATTTAIDINLGTAIEKDGTFIVELHNRWVTKCDSLSAEERRRCSLSECDFKEYFGETCKIDNLLLFRGENSLKKFPALAGLARTHIQGSSFLEQAAGASESSTALLSQLRKEISKLGPVRDLPESGLVLSVEREGRAWFQIDEVEDRVMKMLPGTDPRPVPTALLAYGIHVQGLPFLFHDASLLSLERPYSELRGNDHRLDPLVSFSYAIWIPVQFASPRREGTLGRIVVLSLPRNQIDTNCPRDESQGFPSVGALWDAGNCDISQATQWSESEVDAVMYPDSKYVAGSFHIPYGTEIEYGNFAD